MDAIWYDAIILALLVFCTWRGSSKGFAWQIATIGAIILCFVFAETGSLVIAPLIQVDPPLNRWIAMFVLYIGASFVSFAAARMVRGTLKKWQFEEFDSHLGAIFGFVKGVAFALVITFFAVTLSETLRGQVMLSHSGQAAGRILLAVHHVLPEGFHGVIDPYIERLGHTVVHDEHDSPQSHDGHDHSDEHGFGHDPWQGSGSGTRNVTTPTQPPTGQQYDEFGPRPLIQEAPTPLPANAIPPEATRRITSFEQILNDIPNDLKDSAVRAWQNTKPEDREELLASFQTAIPGVIKAVSQEWASGKPQEAASRNWRDETLREIAGVYTKDLNAQQNIVRQAEDALRGVPDEVGNAVIRDWYADLFGLDGEDPDPATTFETRFDVRIRRQLEAFGISLDRLQADLRDRLQGKSR